MAGAWFGHTDTVTFHDPLAAATLFEPEICHYQSGHIEIEIADSKQFGFTRWNAASSDDSGANADAVHQIAVAVDADKFFQLYFETI